MCDVYIKDFHTIKGSLCSDKDYLTSYDFYGDAEITTIIVYFRNFLAKKNLILYGLCILANYNGVNIDRWDIRGDVNSQEVYFYLTKSHENDRVI